MIMYRSYKIWIFWKKIPTMLLFSLIILEFFLQWSSLRCKHGLGIEATSDNPDLTFESLYSDGITSYLENNWAGCISYLELALEDWKWWNDSIIRCRRRCYNEANSAKTVFPKSEDFQDDVFLEKMVINTLCLVNCKKRVFGQRMDKDTPADVVTDFKLKKPYDYLQLCYFRHGQIDKAANAAATFLVTQPDHEVMQQNLKYYVKEGGLDIENIVNLELKDYAREYIEGDKAYQEERYSETIDHLERSLSLFWEVWNDCRFGCENPFDQGWYPDFVSSIANHYTFTLRCKRKCTSQLSNLYGEEMDDFVASIFNYLQYSYYQVGNIQKGCEAVETFLVLNPDDSSQLRNKQFYWTQEGVREEDFRPRKDVLEYKKRIDLENTLIKYIEESFTDIFELHKPTTGVGSLSAVPGVDTPTETEEALRPSISESLLKITELLARNEDISTQFESILRTDGPQKDEL